MEYVLVGDDCHDCRYVKNTLSFLNLPHKIISVDDINDSQAATGAFLCGKVSGKHAEKLNELISSMNIPIISWAANKLASDDNALIRLIKMPFGEYELKNALIWLDHYREKQLDLTHPAFDKLIGKSKAINDIKVMIAQVAQTDTTVLIAGPSGAGKDIVASCIHQLSKRQDKPFVPINCGAIPSELMESELFGHEKGAFTGATARRPGRFEMANHGTLFLDEVGDMPLAMQVKLLRVLQDGKIERVGGNSTIEVDVRIITASHKNLETLIHKNQFRDDLYYRLNVFPIHVPSLSERKEDIPLIIDYQLDKIYQRLNHKVVFTDEAMALLVAHPWLGNIRELQNILERMVILYPDQVIDPTRLSLPTPQKRRRNKSIVSNDE